MIPTPEKAIKYVAYTLLFGVLYALIGPELPVTDPDVLANIITELFIFSKFKIRVYRTYHSRLLYLIRLVTLLILIIFSYIL